MSEETFPEVDAEVVVSEIVMLRAESSNAILVVEGSSDEKLLWDFIDHNRCSVVIAEGKEKATKASDIIDEEDIKGVLCLVDRDCDDFLGVNSAKDNVIVTSMHDLEMNILHSLAFPKLLREMGSKQKIARIHSAGSTPLTYLLEAAYPLAVLRFISSRDRLYLKFEGLNLRSVNRKNLNTDEDQLCGDLINHSRSEVKVHDLINRLQTSKSRTHSHPMICCGHDVTIMIGKALQSLFGSKNAILVEADEIESRLRLAYGWDSFIMSSVYLDMRAWESRNLIYKILIP